MAWKGAGVALLAVYAALKARNLDGWLICAVMAFGALGDVLLEAAEPDRGSGRLPDRPLDRHRPLSAQPAHRRDDQPESYWLSCWSRRRVVIAFPAAGGPRGRAGRGALFAGPGPDGGVRLDQPVSAAQDRDQRPDLRGGLGPADLRAFRPP